MALADYQPERSEVTYKGKSLISVRGLSFMDTTVLVRNHLPEITELYKVFKNSEVTSEAAIEELIVNLLIKAPDTAARIIAIASDEPGNIEDAKRLSLPLQVKIVIEIVRLTFEDVGGPLAFAAMLKPIVAAEMLDAMGAKAKKIH